MFDPTTHVLYYPLHQDAFTGCIQTSGILKSGTFFAGLGKLAFGTTSTNTP